MVSGHGYVLWEEAGRKEVRGGEEEEEDHPAARVSYQSRRLYNFISYVESLQGAGSDSPTF